jgi:hypothetical protein
MTSLNSVQVGLFGTHQKDERRPGKEDHEEKDSLPNQFGIHRSSSDRGDLRLDIFLIKIGYSLL